MIKLSRPVIAAILVSLALPAFAGSVGKAKDAIDPDCTPEKAVKGAAMKATVGVGNRCDVGETVRDASGVDDKLDGANPASNLKPGKKLDN